MAGGNCCQLVGNLNLGLPGCIISVSTSCNIEIGALCGNEPVEGTATHTVNLSAYADSNLWIGCPAKAGVNISWIRKYDCINDKSYMIFAGQGQSFISGNIMGFASVNKSLSVVSSFSANSSSGPTSIYMDTEQINGYGLNYSGEPFSFDTGNPDLEFNLGSVLGGSHYLQSFNFDAQSGQLPIATYTFIKPIGGN